MKTKQMIGGGIKRVWHLLLQMVGKYSNPTDHGYKELIVKRYAQKYDCNIFLETGTYRGEMDRNVYNYFEYLASVEIQPSLYSKNLEIFRNYPKLHLYLGDSTTQIPVMLEDIKKTYREKPFKVCFWLDGHYSAGETGRGEKDTPIIEELQGIKDQNIGECVILIDDARCFTHEGEFADYPTIPFLREYVNELFHVNSFTVKNDIIRVVISE